MKTRQKKEEIRQEAAKECIGIVAGYFLSLFPPKPGQPLTVDAYLFTKTIQQHIQDAFQITSTYDYRNTMKKVTAIDHKGQKIEFDVEEVFKETIALYHKDIQQETAREIMQRINTVHAAELGTYARIELTMWISERYGLNEQQSKHHESTDTNTKRDTTD